MEHDGNGIVELVGGLVGFIIAAIPFQNIFARAGFGRAWAFLLVFGPLGVFTCWLMLAIRRWPVKEEA